MAILAMRHDFRARPGGAGDAARDLRGRARAVRVGRSARLRRRSCLSEHHGVDDGWLPAPLTMAAAVLARTEQARVMISASILPLHDPIRIAEQIAVIDNAFPGRLWVIFGAGYRVEEFEMAGPRARGARTHPRRARADGARRARRARSSSGAGRNVIVTPKPVTDPRRLLMVGGGVPAAARRAARLRLPMLPMNTDAVGDATPTSTRRRRSATRTASSSNPVGPTFVYVTERSRRDVGRDRPVPALRVADLRVVPDAGPAFDARRATPQSLADLQKSAAVRRRDAGRSARATAATCPPMGGIVFNPLAGGMPPALAWSSLSLFASDVLPRLTA